MDFLQAERKFESRKGQESLSGMISPFSRLSARACLFNHALYELRRRERSPPRVRLTTSFKRTSEITRVDAVLKRCGEVLRNYGETTTRTILPAGGTAAKRGGRPVGQADKLFEDRLLLLSKASAP